MNMKYLVNESFILFSSKASKPSRASNPIQPNPIQPNPTHIQKKKEEKTKRNAINRTKQTKKREKENKENRKLLETLEGNMRSTIRYSTIYFPNGLLTYCHGKQNNLISFNVKNNKKKIHMNKDHKRDIDG